MQMIHARILLIKVNQLGDNIVQLPLVDWFVYYFGKDNIFVVTTPIAAGLYEQLIRQENLYVVEKDKFLGSYKHPLELARWISEIRRLRLNCLVVPMDQGSTSRILATFSGARKVVSVDNPNARIPCLRGARIRLNEKLPHQELDWLPTSYLAKLFGIHEPSCRPPRPSLLRWGINRAERVSYSHKDLAKPTVIIHPGSSRGSTQWGGGRFLEVAKHLINSGVCVKWMNEGVLVAEAAQIGASILERETLRKFAKTISEADLFLGNNSGPMHLADAIGVPMVIIPGPASSGWDPYWTHEVDMLRVGGLRCQPCETIGKRIFECPMKNHPFACFKWVESKFVADLVLRRLNVSAKT